MRRVLVVIEDDSARQALQVRLRSEGFETIGVASVEGARRALAAGQPVPFLLVPAALVREAATLPGAEARPGLGVGAGAPIVIAVLPPGAGDAAGLAAIAGGADDFIRPDAGAVHAGEALAEAASLALRKAAARAERAPLAAVPGTVPAVVTPIVGESPAMAALARSIAKVAPYKATVLVEGESGTGKELTARSVHDQSPRAARPFVAVNCGAIPAGLMESELFGHCKGAFTDAARDRVGLLEQASGGTLFLDELAELQPALQVKLLRVLQDERVRRVGDSEDRLVDVRLVAATARDLEAEVAAGRFREDLFHRINVVSLRVPPLRARADDIPRLAAHFLARTNQRLRLAVGGVTPEAMRILCAYPWPGNVRELENTVERAAVMCEEGEIDVASLPDRIRDGRGGATPTPTPIAAAASPSDPAGDLSIKRAARRAEEDLIRQALARTGGNRTRAAELLEISHRALLYKIKEYGVHLPMTSSGPANPLKPPKF